MQGQVAAAVDVVHVERAAAALVVDIDGDGARDVAVDVRAAEGAAERAAKEVEGHVAVDVGRLGGGAFRAAVDVVHCAAVDVEGDVAGDIGQVGAAVHLVELARAAGDGQGHVARDVGLVAAAEEGAYKLFLVVAARAVAAGAVVLDGEALGAADGTAGVRTGEDGGVVAAVV